MYDLLINEISMGFPSLQSLNIANFFSDVPLTSSSLQYRSSLSWGGPPVFASEVSKLWLFQLCSLAERNDCITGYLFYVCI